MLGAALLLSPLILVPSTTLFGEATSFFAYPYVVIKHQLLTLHTLPLWDPSSGCGDPLLANPLAGQFYPPAWLTFLAPTVPLGLRWVVYLHLIAAAVGSYTLARWVGCAAIAAVLVPIGFLFTPYSLNLVINGLPGVLYAFTWIAWGAACLWRGTTKDEARWLVGAGLCLAAQVFAGTTYDVHFTVLLYGLLLGFTAALQRRPWHERIARLCRQAGLVYASAIGVAAIKLLPVLEYKPISTRNRLSLYEIEHLGENPSWADLKTFLMHFFGSPGPIEAAWINHLYLSLVLLAIGTLIFRSSQRRATFIFTIVLLTALWAALCSAAPFVDLFAILYYLLPGFQYSNYTGRILILAQLAFPLLAALGATQILRYAASRAQWLQQLARRGIAAVGIGGIAFVCLPFSNYVARYPYARWTYHRQAFLAAMAAPPRVMVEGSSRSLRVCIDVKNVGDHPWRGGTVAARWALGSLPPQTSNIPRTVAPGDIVTLDSRLPLPPPSAPMTVPLRLSLITPWEAPLEKTVAYLATQSNGAPLITVQPVAADWVVSGAALFDPHPGDWNSLLGILARWHAPEQFRVYRDGMPDVYPYTAFLHGFQTVEFSNHGILPKYHLLPYWKPGHPDEISRMFKMLRILNTRYLLRSKDFAPYLDPGQTRLLLKRPDGELYELTTALPRVWAPRATALLIGDDRDHDFDSLEAKMVVYQEEFDPAAWAVFWKPTAFLDDLTVADILPFQAVLLTRSRLRNAQKALALLDAYRQAGGHILELPYVEYRYLDPFSASGSMFDNLLPAKALGDEARRSLASLLTSRATPVMGRVSIALAHDQPNHRVYHINTDQSTTPVVISDTYYPGWSATVDGQPTPLYMANGIVRGIVVYGRGGHTVEFRYAPATFRWGSLITAGSLLAIGYLWLRRRRDS